MGLRTQALRPPVVSRVAQPARKMSAIRSLYPTIMDSNMKYLTFIVGGAVAIGGLGLRPRPAPLPLVQAGRCTYVHHIIYIYCNYEKI